MNSNKKYGLCVQKMKTTRRNEHKEKYLFCVLRVLVFKKIKTTKAQNTQRKKFKFFMHYILTININAIALLYKKILYCSIIHY